LGVGDPPNVTSAEDSATGRGDRFPSHLRDRPGAEALARTTMPYDRARKNLDRHPHYILAAYMASAT